MRRAGVGAAVGSAAAAEDGAEGEGGVGAGGAALRAGGRVDGSPDDVPAAADGAPVATARD